MHAHLHKLHVLLPVIKRYFFFSLFLFGVNVSAQTQPFNKKTFFTDEQVLEFTLAFDFKKFRIEKNDTVYQPAIITFLADAKEITDQVQIKMRGVQRKAICNPPPMMIQFNSKKTKHLNNLGRLKLVSGCDNSVYSEQLILKEYLVYKIYNLFTEKSFNARLVKMNFKDNNNKNKDYKQYSFFIEDTDDMAKRNGCTEISKKHNSEQTNREHTTMVVLFQYMIGNADFAIPVFKNIKLIAGKNTANEKPYVIPYDYDYAGIVDAKYAIPHPDHGIEDVKERAYKGFPRTEEELENSLNVFFNLKEKMYALINNFTLLSVQNRKEMMRYLDEFYVIASNKKSVKEIFITNARRQ